MDYSIEVDGISKVYKLYNKPSDRLKEALSPIKRVIIPIFMRYMI